MKEDSRKKINDNLKAFGTFLNFTDIVMLQSYFINWSQCG